MRRSPRHVIALCERSRQGDEAIRKAADIAALTGAKLTIVAAAVTERVDIGCCDLRSTYWNGVVKELAADDLLRAQRVLGPIRAASVRIVAGPSLSSALAAEAERCGADTIVLPAQRGVVPWTRRRRARQMRRTMPPSVALIEPGR
jgi:hypothetical protein